MTTRPAESQKRAKDSHGDDVVECPFCGSDVGGELVTYGGTCPKCFAEIPGDEAPTDPGVEVRAAQERQDRRRRTARLAAAFGALLALVTCTGLTAAGFVIYSQSFETAAVLDFDTLDFPMPEIVAGEAVAAAEAPAPTPAPGAPRGSSKAGSSTRSDPGRFAGGGNDGVASGGGTPDLAQPSSSGGAGGARRGGTSDPSGPALGPAGAGSSASRPAGLSDFGVPSLKARRDDNVVLSDPDAIRDMIGERMVEQIPGLKLCYDRRLKVVPTLKGRWLVTYQVQKDGSVGNAVAKPLDSGDAELERCLADHVENHWRFSRISVVQPVSKTLRFSP